MESTAGKGRFGTGGWDPGRDRAGRGGGEGLGVRRDKAGLPRVGAWGSLSLTCVPGAAARQLLALGAAPGWGDAGAGGVRGMVRGLAGSGVLERVGGGRPGRGAAAVEAAAGDAPLGSTRLGSAGLGAAARSARSPPLPLPPRATHGLTLPLPHRGSRAQLCPRCAAGEGSGGWAAVCFPAF